MARLSTKYAAPSVFHTQQFLTPCSVCVIWFALQPAGIWLSVLSPNYSNCLSGALMSPTVLGPDCSSGAAWHSSCTWWAWPQPEEIHRHQGTKLGFMGLEKGKTWLKKFSPKAYSIHLWRKYFDFMKWLKGTVDKIDRIDSEIQLAEQCISFQSNAYLIFQV